MAEEQIVLPRERYQRMLQQISEKNDNSKHMHKQPEDDTGLSHTTVDSQKIPVEGDTAQQHTSVDTVKQKEEMPSHKNMAGKPPGGPLNDGNRTKDDVTANPLERNAPPGITPEELKTLVTASKKKKNTSRSGNNRNINAGVKQDTSTARRKRKPYNKTLDMSKKRWLTF